MKHMSTGGWIDDDTAAIWYIDQDTLLTAEFGKYLFLLH